MMVIFLTKNKTENNHWIKLCWVSISFIVYACLRTAGYGSTYVKCKSTATSSGLAAGSSICVSPSDRVFFLPFL